MDLKVVEKSRKLLVQVMGQEDYDKFIEDGKIEIVHGAGNDKVVYELDQDARVFNKTKSESYCIETIAPDSLPIHDILAIKYAYLKNNIKCVEEVANKRSVNTTPVILARPFYSDINLTTKSNSDLVDSPLSYKNDDQWFRFRQGIELNGQERLRVYTIDCETDICARNIRMTLDCDIWNL
jgi:hypothetical protein